MNLLEVSKLSESESRQYLEGIRWPEGPICPHCGNAEKIYALNGKTTREGLYKCAACKKQFTVTVGTVMHRSHLTLQQWVMAFHLMCSSKKGISALQLQRELGIGSYEHAWFLCHRIRAAMEEMNMLSGTVEVDETFVGGKGTMEERSTKKTPVVAIVERKGKIQSKPIKNVTRKTLHEAIKDTVLPDSRIMTDELHSYRGIDQFYSGGHETVNHGRGEYSRGEAHINTAESYFALLKRGIHGTFHQVSRKHLGRYCHEFSFRWNNRDISDGIRRVTAIRQSDLKRITYAQLVNKEQKEERA